MCIRDRSRTVLGEVSFRTLATNFCFSVEGSNVSPASCACCLLYTSDAADERSSVDLGGRRIIKKKNNLCVTGGRSSIYNTTTTKSTHELSNATKNKENNR